MYAYEIYFGVNNQYSTVLNQRGECRRGREYPPPRSFTAAKCGSVG